MRQSVDQVLSPTRSPGLQRTSTVGPQQGGRRVCAELPFNPLFAFLSEPLPPPTHPTGTHGSAGQANYSTAKAGVVGLTKTVAREWGAFNIRCNALAFGHINTRLVQAKERGDSILVDGERVPLGIPGAVMKGARVEDMVALGRKGSPEEAAGSMLLLASPYASYITGQSLEVTGGGWL